VLTWGEDCEQSCAVRPFGLGDNHAGTDPGSGSTSTDMNDKATRYTFTIVDNHNGTVTVSVFNPANVSGGSLITSVTQEYAFPACPCRVVFQDHNYTPNKSSVPRVPNPYTWHWDSIVVR
jgi:hypothetical protein